MRCLSWKNSRVPCVASPSDTMRASPIIFLSGYGDIPSTVRAMKEGAVDFLTKPVAKETLVAAVQNALKLDVERRESRRRLRIWQESFQTLTERERQVFDGVVAGKLNKQIAAELGAAAPLASI